MLDFNKWTLSTEQLGTHSTVNTTVLALVAALGITVAVVTLVLRRQTRVAPPGRTRNRLQRLSTTATYVLVLIAAGLLVLALLNVLESTVTSTADFYYYPLLGVLIARYAAAMLGVLALVVGALRKPQRPPSSRHVRSDTASTSTAKRMTRATCFRVSATCIVLALFM